MAQATGKASSAVVAVTSRTTTKVLSITRR